MIGQNEISNPMCQPRLSKVVVNISVGKSGEQLQKAMTILEQLTEQKPCQRLAKRTVREWGIRKNEPIACLVTLRNEKATKFLEQSLEAIGNKLSPSCFDSHGNFSFGIKEHIDISGVRYDPSLGICGMDVSVVLEKRGYRVKKKRIRRAKIGQRQRLKPKETIEYIKETFGIEMLE